MNAIASSPYWKDSAIIITYDETDGEFDHAQPIVRSQDPEGNPLDQGPRIPMILLSPYGEVHAITHERTEHSSIIKFIDKLFNLTPLADLPDEAAARRLGEARFGQQYLGPADAGVPGVGNLFTAFDNNRLLGTMPPLEASYAMIPTSQTLTLPQFEGQGCRILGIAPTDTGLNGTVMDPAPIDFNPRPTTNPGISHVGHLDALIRILQTPLAGVPASGAPVSFVEPYLSVKRAHDRSSVSRDCPCGGAFHFHFLPMLRFLNPRPPYFPR